MKPSKHGLKGKGDSLVGLEEVKNDILQEAEQKADKIVEEGKKEAEEIVSEAEEEAEEIREKHREELEKQKESYRRKAVSNANMKAKQERLKAREEKLDKAFDRFHEKLKDMDSEDREKYVSGCLNKVEFEVGKVIGGEEFEDSVDTEFEEDDIEGVIVVSEDGTKRQNFTFDKIVGQFRENYRKDVAKELF